MDGFHRALASFLARRPFVPFVIELVSGHRFRVNHPEAVVAGTLLAIYFPTQEGNVVFDASSVCRLCDESGLFGVGWRTS